MHKTHIEVHDERYMLIVLLLLLLLLLCRPA
jgi:hypothetical protein